MTFTSPEGEAPRLLRVLVSIASFLRLHCGHRLFILGQNRPYPGRHGPFAYLPLKACGASVPTHWPGPHPVCPAGRRGHGHGVCRYRLGGDDAGHRAGV